MAKVQQLVNIDNAGEFSLASELTFNASHTKATYTYETGAKIIVRGEGLKGDSEGFSAGTAYEVVYKDMDGNVVVSVEDAKLDVKGFTLGLSAQEAHNFYLSFLDKKDVIKGSDGDDFLQGGNGADSLIGGKGQDQLWGGRGADILKGGADSDTFYIDPSGKGDDDVIRDFDIEGMDMLLLDATIDTIRKANGGEDTLITFTNKGTVLIEDVEKADLMDYWANL